MLRSASILFLIILACDIYGQNILFSYDNAGNRVSKVPVFSMSRASGTEKIHPGMEMSDIEDEVKIHLSDKYISIILANYCESTDCEVLASTLDGKVMARIHADSDVLKLDASLFERGVYIICVTVNEKKWSWKIQRN